MLFKSKADIIGVYFVHDIDKVKWTYCKSVREAWKTFYNFSKTMNGFTRE